MRRLVHWLHDRIRPVVVLDVDRARGEITFGRVWWWQQRRLPRRTTVELADPRDVCSFEPGMKLDRDGLGDD